MNRNRNQAMGNALVLAAAALYVAGVLTQAFAHMFSVGVLLRSLALLLFLISCWRKKSLTVWTFWAMVLGVELGLDTPNFAKNLHFLAVIFLRLIRTAVAPLIFGTITTAIAVHTDMKSLGRLAFKTLIYFEVVTTIALLIGMAAINLSHAGIGVTLPAVAGDLLPAASSGGWESHIINIFPDNMAKSIAEGQILQVAVFAILFGIGMALLPEEKRRPLADVVKSLTETMFRYTRLVTYLAPIAAGAAIAYSVGTTGIGALLPLGKLVATYYVALIVFTLGVLVPLLFFARTRIGLFAKAVSEPAAIAFATSSSEAALPAAMSNLEAIGIPRQIISFVIPTGYSFNMDGASVYLTVTALFAVQAGGMHLTIGQQLIMLATLMLTSKGVAGVPRATLVVLMATAATLHLPQGAMMLLVGVDALMDMGRSAMNVTGNCVATAVISRWEGYSAQPVDEEALLD